MAAESNERGDGELPMGRRLIQVEQLHDQAGITAALRRAFAERPLTASRNDGQHFDELLNQIH